METKGIPILTKNELVKRRVSKSEGLRAQLFYGDRKVNTESNMPAFVVTPEGSRYDKLVIPFSEKWVNSEGYTKLWSFIEDTLKRIKNQIERRVNINQFPEDYYDLINAMVLDVTRRRTEQMDYTAEISQVINRANFSKRVDLTEFLPFAGVFEEIGMVNDNVPMVEHKTGSKGSVLLTAYGLGDARSLEDELYNTDIYSLEKVLTAVARAHTALRNDLSIGQLVALTNTAGGWHASQRVAAAAAATIEDAIYITLNNAIQLLTTLIDPQTNQEIDAPKIVLIVRNRGVARIVNRSIRQILRGDTQIRNLNPLTEIDEIWTYKGDTITVGPRPTTYPGVPQNTAYLIVPGPSGSPFYTLEKRGLTQEVGRGSVLQLSREQRAWYFVQGGWSDEFFGSSDDTILNNLGAGYGFAVTIELPTEET